MSGSARADCCLRSCAPNSCKWLSFMVGIATGLIIISLLAMFKSKIITGQESSDKWQIIDARAVIAAANSKYGIGFNLIHRDAARSPIRVSEVQNSSDITEYFQALQIRMSISSTIVRSGRNSSRGGVQGRITTLGQAGLEYYMPIQMGSPPKEVILVMDTGSDMMWVQCVACKDCAPASQPPFNPKNSSSYITVPCSSATCSALYKGIDPSCSPSGRTCLFRSEYADGSLSSGVLSQETFLASSTFGTPVKLQNVTFGCAHVDKEGTYTGANGLMGMDRRKISFPSQMAAKFSPKFSYCFPDKMRHLNSSGVAFFGDSRLPVGLKYTPILNNNASPDSDLDYYYVGLTGISIDDTMLPISKSQFSIGRSGTGGTIIDSGTAFSYLPLPAYRMIKRVFLNSTSHLTRVKNSNGFSPCYNISVEAFSSTVIPTLVLHLEGGVNLPLGPESILIPVVADPYSTIFCLAFQTSDMLPFSIIGNYQQQNLWIEYDLKHSRIGFAKAKCAID